MIGALLDKAPDDRLQVLLLGAHADDIEIGCGGTILELAASWPNLAVHWMVLTSNDARAHEANDCARRFLRAVPESTIVIERFRDGYLQYEGSRIKDYFERLKTEISPDVIFTHYRDDWHQDHRLVSELTWNTWRDHLILEYEIPKYDPDLGSPNVFVHLSDAAADAKVEHLMEGHPSQATRRWFTRDTFYGLMRLRGVAAQAERYAEAFYCRKLVLGRSAR